MTKGATLCLLASGLAAIVLAAPPSSQDRYWPQWRGPLGTGEAPDGNPPLEWSEGKNVRWKVEVPGQGKSSPIVWGDTVCVTTAVAKSGNATAVAKAPEPAAAPASGGPPMRAADADQEFVVLAYGRADGKVRWRQTVRELRPHEGTHQDGSFAAGSAITDGERLYAFFGSRGLYALDLASGRLLWKKDLGVMSTRMGFGEGSSPALHGGTLVVNWDHEGADFIVALDARTGAERWRKERDEPTTWATPLVVTEEGRSQVVTSGTNRVRSYDLETGALLWEGSGLTANVIPSPVSAEGMVYLTSGFRGNALRAIRLKGAKGDITGTPSIVWSYDRDTPYVPSPLLYRDALYFLKSNSAVITRLEAQTGKASYTERLDGMTNVYASPVGAAGRVYVTGRDGVTAVLDAGPQLKVLGRNALSDAIDASPAIVEGEMYLRGSKYLYRISAD
jgi:outer membrane protein assembly factor BamB